MNKTGEMFGFQDSINENNQRNQENQNANMEYEIEKTSSKRILTLERKRDDKDNNQVRENISKKLEEVREKSTSKSKSKTNDKILDEFSNDKNLKNKKVSTKTHTIYDPDTKETKIVKTTTILEKDIQNNKIPHEKGDESNEFYTKTVIEKTTIISDKNIEKKDKNKEKLDLSK